MVIPLTLSSDPWGKDSDLACKLTKNEKAILESTPTISFSCALIRFHQNVISPADGPRSHYFPSSSQYTLEAIQTYGFIKGFILGCDRLMRENDDPWVYRKALTEDKRMLKYDPIK